MLLKNINRFINKIANYSLNPGKAYDLWAENYDAQDDNLIFRLEKEILDSLLAEPDLTGKSILDYGCGTGRNWPRLLSYNAGKITGCDISPKMLEQLKNKFKGYDTYLIKENSPLPVNSGTIDFIFSTLVVAQIKNLKNVFGEWSRMLKPGGLIIITDLHPAVLSAGGKRTFEKEGRIYTVKNYTHTIDIIRTLCGTLNMEVAGFRESYITNELKEFYEKKNALHIYERFYGLPLVYGMLIRKCNDSAKS